MSSSTSTLCVFPLTLTVKVVGGDLLVEDHCHSALLVRVKDVILSLHGHMANVSAV